MSRFPNLLNGPSMETTKLLLGQKYALLLFEHDYIAFHAITVPWGIVFIRTFANSFPIYGTFLPH